MKIIKSISIDLDLANKIKEVAAGRNSKESPIIEEALRRAFTPEVLEELEFQRKTGLRKNKEGVYFCHLCWCARRHTSFGGADGLTWALAHAKEEHGRVLSE